jgi:DNA-binding SARP family transcriptional activator/WD40 repeat protein
VRCTDSRETVARTVGWARSAGLLRNVEHGRSRFGTRGDMRYGILGPLEVITDDGGAVVPSGVKARALLAVLLLHANEPMSAERLAVALWGEDAPAGSIKTVQVHVSRLRKALGDGAVIETTPAGYCLRVGPGELDAERFDRLVDGGRRALADGDAQRAVTVLREALQLWRGPALSDLAHESFAVSEIRRLEERRLTANELVIEGELAAGGHRELVEEIEALVIDHPLRERLHAQRMLALYRAGRQSEALEAYRHARRLLVDEIGVEPGAELRELHELILRQDASLDFVVAELPRELDAAAIQAIVGRDRELRWLLARWDRARTGAGELVAVIGPVGIGRTRLAAALASEVHRQRADIVYAAGWQRSEDVVAAIRRSAQAERPTLLVVDDADANGDAMAALGAIDLSGTATLVVATVQDAGDLGAGTWLVLEPLDAEAVCQIALLYAPGRAAADVPIEELLAASGGVPRRMHDVASGWARREASRRVVALAPCAAADRDQLRSTEAELAGGVADLQAARARGDLLGAPEEPAVCPFKGLAFFDVADARFFFGRERLIAELVARAVGAPLLGVVGPSGSGKSSVLRAGLLPALAAGVLPGSDEWRQVLIRPGEHPLAELLGATADVSRDERIVLAVDQFEEVFTACRDERERTAFIDALVSVAKRRSGRIVVLAVRADFYGRCATHRTLSGLLGAGHVLVGPMQSDELRRAIELPARRAGLHAEPELVDALVADVADEPGALPLLSAALLELWQRRDGRRLRHATYERAGGVRGAVARLAEQAFAELEPAQQRIARRVLLRLAGEGPDGTVVRRRIPHAELEGDADEDVERVLAVLADRRLLTVSATTVEVAHEALLREWPRLREWLEEDAQGRSIHRHLADVAREWNERGRDPGDVYRGARLAAALEWRTGHDDDLNTVERDFLDAGREIAGRAQRRLRLVLAGVAALLVVAVLGGAVALHQRSTARKEAVAAEAQRLGAQALTEGDLGRSLLLARQGVVLDDSPATRSNLLAAVVRAPAAIAVSAGDGNPLRILDLDPEGRTLAVGDSHGNVLFLDAKTRRAVAPPYKTGSSISGLRFSPDGTRIAISGEDSSGGGFIDLLDGRTHRRIAPRSLGFAFTGIVGKAVFSPDSRVLAADFAPSAGFRKPANRDFVMRWNARTGRARGFLQPIGQMTPPALVGFVDGGTRFVTSSFSGTVIRDAATLRAVRRFHAGGMPAAVSPDGRLFALCGFDGSVRLLDLRTGAVRALAGRHDAAISAIRFAPSSRTLLTAGRDARTIVWDVKHAAPVETFAGHAGPVTDVTVAPDGRTAYSTGEDGHVIAWDLVGTRRLGQRFRTGSRLPATVLAVSAASSTFAVPTDGGYVDLFDSRTLTHTRRIHIFPVKPASGRPMAVAIAPDGRTLAAATPAAIRLVDVRTGRFLGAPLPMNGSTQALAFSGDGRWLASSSAERAVYVWDVRRHKPVDLYVSLTGPATALSMRPRGSDVVATVEHQDGTGELDLLSPPHRVSLARTLTSAATQSLFSRDGRLFFYRDDTGRFWTLDARTWKPRGRPLSGASGRGAFAISPDGRTLATASNDGGTQLWELASGRAIGNPLPGVADQSAGATFIDGGTHLATVYNNRQGYVWDVRPESWARWACDIAGRTLTRAEWKDVLPERSYAPACAHR